MTLSELFRSRSTCVCVEVVLLYYMCSVDNRNSNRSLVWLAALLVCGLRFTSVPDEDGVTVEIDRT